MKPRIFGIETEYGIAAIGPDGQPALSAEAASRELFFGALARGRSSNMFLGNGGRLYLDVGAHPEYATAECANLTDLLIQDGAGTALLTQMAKEANQRLAQTPGKPRLHLLKNNLDSEGNSFGCHENYLLHRDAKFRDFADSMITFLVTRQILTGAGHLVIAEDGRARYEFSQRAHIFQDAISSATTRTRPLINTRDEPLADADKYRRLHVISGDSNISQASSALKVFSTRLLLDALEDGLDLSDLKLADPIAASGLISGDLRCRQKLELEGSGKSLTALEIQTEIFARLTPWAEQANLDEIEKYCWKLWQRTLQALGAGQVGTLSGELDWAVKYRLLSRVAARAGYDLAGFETQQPLSAQSLPLPAEVINQLRTWEYTYHDVTAPLAGRLEATGQLKRLIGPGLIENGKTKPPQNTRAYLRGTTIALALENRRDLAADWNHLRLDQSELPTVILADPFATTDPRVEQLQREIVESTDKNALTTPPVI